MKQEDLRAVVLNVLGEIAPEADLENIDPETDFVDQLEIDSMDQLNLMIGLHDILGIDIPETDYRALSSLRLSIEYLERRLENPT
jgi:acyl carrier protein